MSDDIGRVAAGDGPARLPPGPAVHRAGRQRRPTGAPPPLPYRVTISSAAWLVLAAIVLAAAFVAAQDTPWLRVDDQAGTQVLRQLAGIRTPWLTDVANGINVAGSGWGASVLGLSVVALTIAFRRWRHLAVFVGSLLFLGFAGTWIYSGLSRPRPYGVPIIGSWAGYASGSPVTGVLTFCLMGVVYCLVVPGRARSRAKAAAAATVTVFVLARLYLGVDHPDDVLVGAALAVAVAVTAFRYFTPNEVFPVAYRRGRTAHVDVTGRRGKAIRRAVADQLGLHVTEIKPHARHEPSDRTNTRRAAPCRTLSQALSLSPGAAATARCQPAIKAARGRLERTAVTRRTGRSGARSIASRPASIVANIRQRELGARRADRVNHAP